ncbi:30S ribosomal protein S17 [Patescibacteria group bacterium]
MVKSKSEKQSKKRIIKGKVVSNSADKTVKIEVETYKTHPVYHKRYKFTRHYQAHDPKNQFKKGDLIEIKECRPFSRTKRFKVVYSK